MAHRYMRQERPGAGFQTTELVNEVYLKLVDCSRVRWQEYVIRIWSRWRLHAGGRQPVGLIVSI